MAAFVLLLGLGAARAGRAQQVLVHGEVASDTARRDTGPNRRFFAHTYLAYGLLAGPSGTGAAVRYGFPSYEMQLGTRFKRRLSQHLAWTLDLRYAYLRHALRQTDQKTLPSPARHLSETLNLHQAQAELGLRLNFDRRRGDVIGHYLDLLAWGGWVAGTSHVTEDVPGPTASAAETTERGLDYLRRWHGGPGLRLGTGHLALTGRYRLSPAFTSDYPAFSELPRYVLGLELGLF